MFDKKVLSDIHARFRQLRSGELADNLALQGVKYRIAWGLESYRLKEIAEDFEQNAELAEALWEEDVRESKMLATRLFPTNELSAEKALSWVKEARYTEIADQVCMNLLARMSSSEELAESLAKAEIKSSPIEIYSALKLATRIEYKSEKILALAEEILSGDYEIYLKTAALWYKQIYVEE